MNSEENNSQYNKENIEPPSQDEGGFSDLKKVKATTIKSRLRDPVLAVLALVIGVCAFFVAWVPLLGVVTLLLSIPGLILAIISWILSKRKSDEYSLAIPIIAFAMNVISIGLVAGINGGIAYMGYEISKDFPIEFNMQNGGSFSMKNDSLSVDGNLVSKKIATLNIEETSFEIVDATPKDLEINPDAKILKWQAKLSQMDSVSVYADVTAGFYDSSGVLIYEDNIWKQELVPVKDNLFEQSIVLSKKACNKIKDISLTIKRSE